MAKIVHLKNKMKVEIPEFKEFPDSNISGRMIVNPYWLELFHKYPLKINTIEKALGVSSR